MHLQILRCAQNDRSLSLQLGAYRFFAALRMTVFLTLVKFKCMLLLEPGLDTRDLREKCELSAPKLCSATAPSARPNPGVKNLFVTKTVRRPRQPIGRGS